MTSIGGRGIGRPGPEKEGVADDDPIRRRCLFLSPATMRRKGIQSFWRKASQVQRCPNSAVILATFVMSTNPSTYRLSLG